jgi:hypothetical protein
VMSGGAGPSKLTRDRVMRKQEQVAEDLEQAATEVARFIEDCPESAWRRVYETDGRTVASLAHHCALGNDLAMGWVCQMLTGRPIYETEGTHDALNIVEGERSAELSKDDVTEALQRSTRRTVHFLRSLTDEELARTALHGVAGREMSVGQFIPAFARHMRGHLENLKEAAKADI